MLPFWIIFFKPCSKNATFIWTSIYFMFHFLTSACLVSLKRAQHRWIFDLRKVFFFFCQRSQCVLWKTRWKQKFLLWASHQRLSFPSRLNIQMKRSIQELPKRIFWTHFSPCWIDPLLCVSRGLFLLRSIRIFHKRNRVSHGYAPKIVALRSELSSEATSRVEKPGLLTSHRERNKTFFSHSNF